MFEQDQRDRMQQQKHHDRALKIEKKESVRL